MSQTRLTFNYTSACNLPLIPHITSSAAEYDTARAVTGRGPFRRPLLLAVPLASVEVVSSGPDEPRTTAGKPW
jgi:hypothetical protein